MSNVNRLRCATILFKPISTITMEQLLTTNAIFRNYLMSFNEWSVIETGSIWVPEWIMRDTLCQMGDNLCVYLNENFDLVDVHLNPYHSEQKMREELTQYLSQLNGEEIYDLYQSFMTSYGVIEDLMILEEDERIDLLNSLTGKDRSYYRLINLARSRN